MQTMPYSQSGVTFVLGKYTNNEQTEKVAFRASKWLLGGETININLQF